MRNDDAFTSLRAIAVEHNGLLRPEDVVEAARPLWHPLHRRFTWDDTRAADLYRLEEARKLIRVTVQYAELDHEVMPVRCFVSLTPDRAEEGGGYRETAVVMNNRSFREQLLADARAEMESFQRKYARLTELAEVFRAMRKAQAAKAPERAVESRPPVADNRQQAAGE